jgi:regulator of vacuolar morphogenesis
MLGALEEGLKHIQGDTGIRSGWGMGTGGASQLGSGELRRRKDLLASARKEKDGLENLLNAMATKSKLDSAVATMRDKERLIGRGPSGKPKPGRVLGKETDQTRELDNEGVMQFQKQIMQNQDQSAEELLKILSRQKQLGVAINEELQIQKELLNQVDEDVDRLVLLASVGFCIDYFDSNLNIIIGRGGKSISEGNVRRIYLDLQRSFPLIVICGALPCQVLGRPF